MFAHLPLLVDDKDGRCRSGGVTWPCAYRDQGFLPEAMVNYLALLGWSLDDKTNIFSRTELVEHFSLARVGKNPAAFDVAKLEWLNGHYIRSSGAHDVATALAPFCREEGLPVDSPAGFAVLEEVTPLLTERMKRLSEAPSMIRFLFEEPRPDDKAAAALAGQESYLAEVADRLQAVEKWTTAAIEETMRALAAERDLKPKKAFQPVRAAVTGTLVSPPLFESLEILGRERTLARLRAQT